MLSDPATEVTAATKKPVQLPLLVTGCGRSGTKYIAFALRRMGLDVRHERLGRDGISSWTMAVRTERRPYGPPSSASSFKQIFHQTREPLQVIQSCLSFTESSWDFISENVPCPRIAPLIIRAATYWLLWNEKAEEIATWRYRIEDFPDLALEEFRDRLKGFYDRRSIDTIPRNFNTRKQHQSIGQLQRRSCRLTSALRPGEGSRQFARGCGSFLPFTRARQDRIRASERNGLADRVPARRTGLHAAFSVSLEVAGALIFLNRHYGEYEHLTRVRGAAPDFSWGRR
jgi:hypothetical protein